MSRLTRTVDASCDAMSRHSCPDVIEDRVMELTGLMAGGGASPVECTLILARTSWTACLGMSGAISQGLQVGEIYDLEDLRHVVAALRASADVFEAILREGTQ